MDDVTQPKGMHELLELGMGIKAVFCDLDGTFLDAHHLMPTCGPACIRALMGSGVAFIPTTGRTVYAMRKVLGSEIGGLDLDFVACNGMDVHVLGKDALHSECPRDMAWALVERIADDPRPLGLVVFGAGEPYVFDLEADYTRAKIESLHHCPIRGLDEGLEEGPISKFGIVAHDGAQQLAADLTSQFGEHLLFSAVGDEWVDVATKGHAKLEGIELVCRVHGWKADEVLAIGDSMNDWSMLSHFPHSACVSNAMPQIKEICRYEVGSNLDFAVPRLFELMADRRKAKRA